LHAVEVVHRARLRVFAQRGVIAGQQQHVGHPEGRRAEQVGLQGHPVAVAAGQLHHRLEPGP
jgi:hypothetical protein